MAFLDSVFNPVLMPLLKLNVFWGIVIISLLISLLMTYVYKWVTDQKKMKELRDKQKEFQQQMKENRSNPEQLMKLQKEAMQTNFEYMKKSFKPTLITMIPILLILGWMSAHLSFEPIIPGQEFSVTATFNAGVSGEATLSGDVGLEILSNATQTVNGIAGWKLKGTEGEHLVTITKESEAQTKKILITRDLSYEVPVSSFTDSAFQSIQVEQMKLQPLRSLEIPWVSTWGWLGWYIVFSLIFSMALRKVLKIY